ncbi:hypothetical protein WPS_33360 [Vulcanimicrobium alpinum]|uniref:AlgX/AlgJ SGNH hydrolase-like domain-containing protein n=1 Tax=Vulcanimicrobium alpinum TaxID=3016050 RepID=A0AAN1XZ60_UNVUL|nr:hypothetical protein [Vulcanimicrobium alpinum]BDE08060.1 hypothetical protein WPS_33360 [Vulcanimicrobium alpinum]
MPPQRSPRDLIVIGAFALLLVLPAALALLGRAGADTEFITTVENRRPFVAPPVTSGALATGGWERDAERQIADAFPLRKHLIEAYDYVKYAWLGDGAGNRVLRGRDGWFYLGDEELTYLTDAYAVDAVVAHLADVYAARSAWCAQHGMHYAFVLAANKSTIYPQYLPAGLAIGPPAADRLVAALRARGVRTIDTRPPLIAAARGGTLLYSKGDTHWNAEGAAIAARAIAANLGVRDRVAAGAIRYVDRPDRGDLLNFAGIGSFVSNDVRFAEFSRTARDVPMPSYGGDPAAARYSAHASAIDDPALPSAVIFGDSFLEGLEPFLAEDFRRAVFLHHISVEDVQFDRAILGAERPQIVLQELVERSIVFGASFTP